MTIADAISYSRATTDGGRYARNDYQVLSGPGFFVVSRSHRVPRDQDAADWLQGLDATYPPGWSAETVDSHARSRPFDGFDRIGFSSGIDVPRNARVARHWWGLEVPHWLTLLVISLPLGIAGVRRWRRRRVSGLERCNACGYDVRATPGRCPECGAVPAGANVSAEARRR
jgi:hypothetical protein